MPDFHGGTKRVAPEYFVLGPFSLGVLRLTSDRQKLFAFAADINWLEAIGGEVRRNVLE
jgi:hypothetical protein